MAQVKVGTVVSDKMKDTVVIKTIAKTWHPLYKKQITKSRKFKAHNDMGAKLNDNVKAIETKPYSKTVHFKVIEIIGGKTNVSK